MYELLPQTVESALPSWESMDPHLPNNENVDPDAQSAIERLRVQKKAYRSRKVLMDPKKKASLCLLGIIGPPVQHAMMRVDALDEAGGTLLDCLLPETCPIRECRRELRRIIDDGCEEGSMLEPVFRHFVSYALASLKLCAHHVNRSANPAPVETTRVVTWG